MRLIETRLVKEGSLLAKTIYNNNDDILLHEGVLLTSRMIERLCELGVAYINIHDSLTADITSSHEGIHKHTRKTALEAIKKEFHQVTDSKSLSGRLNNEYLDKNFSVIIKMILEDISKNKNALSMITNVVLHDSYIFTHSLNVTIYTLGLAIQLGFTERQLYEIGLGAILHDIGKVQIPLSVLNKESGLTDLEYKEIKDHTVFGYEMIKDIPGMSLMTAHCALQHHERLDGSGYPFGRTEIHPYAKIIAVCDVFDAVTTNRSYRKGMLPQEGLELLYSGIGTHFDIEIVEAFRDVIAIYPIGLSVTLSDGRKAVVIKQNKEVTARPVVRVYAENGKKVTPYDINLVEQMNVTIVQCGKNLTAKPILI
ncbi:HD-GYP domain-containing protein [Bacillus alkalicellulosilyticus]|uniref:HD-GYP domain-containing protein n=1 Tax=Alkalihalobacterium alkalicellulosilyticum TaxID=1912214 RepID=UPI0009978602|nr:HD-GYP domain-containing protein [Bacillus alkalicellulosilyticus]